MSSINEKLLDDIVNDLAECGAEKQEIQAIERKYGVSIAVDKEKHHALQYTYYYTVGFEGETEPFCVEIEDGINNGTEVVNQGWSCKTPNKRMDNVFIGIKANIKEMLKLSEKNGDESFISIGTAKQLANEFGISDIKPVPNSAFFNALIKFKEHKKDIEKLYSQKSYDNYVTGGGTTVTDRYFASQFSKYTAMNLAWDCEFELQECDIHFC